MEPTSGTPVITRGLIASQRNYWRVHASQALERLDWGAYNLAIAHLAKLNVMEEELQS